MRETIERSDLEGSIGHMVGEMLEQRRAVRLQADSLDKDFDELMNVLGALNAISVARGHINDDVFAHMAALSCPVDGVRLVLSSPGALPIA